MLDGGRLISILRIQEAFVIAQTAILVVDFLSLSFLWCMILM